MKAFGVLYLFEWKKILRQGLVPAAILLGVLLLLAANISPLLGTGYYYRYDAQWGTVDRIAMPYGEVEKLRRDSLRALSGQVLDEALMDQLKENYRDSQAGTIQWNLNAYSPFLYLNTVEDQSGASAEDFYRQQAERFQKENVSAPLTDAELEETPPAQPHLCDRCGKCAQACPGHAIDPSSGEVDHWQCAAYYVGANMTKNPFMPPDAYLHEPDRLAIIAGEAKLSPERARKIIDETFFYPPIKHAYLSSICGRACDVACYIHLEEKGVLKRSFKTPFRKRPEWKLSIQIETEEEKNAHA